MLREFRAFPRAYDDITHLIGLGDAEGVALPLDDTTKKPHPAPAHSWIPGTCRLAPAVGSGNARAITPPRRPRLALRIQPSPLSRRPHWTSVIELRPAPSSPQQPRRVSVPLRASFFGAYPVARAPLDPVGLGYQCRQPPYLAGCGRPAHRQDVGGGPVCLPAPMFEHDEEGIRGRPSGLSRTRGPVSAAVGDLSHVRTVRHRPRTSKPR